MEKLEPGQNSAALAVAGAWRGTSQDKLYDELGWVSLNFQSWNRCLILFYQIVKNLTPYCTTYQIPNLMESTYELRRHAAIGKFLPERKALNPASTQTACLNVIGSAKI